MARVRAAYVSSFDFRGLGLDDGLRMFLETFRLPKASGAPERWAPRADGQCAAAAARRKRNRLIGA